MDEAGGMRSGHGSDTGFVDIPCPLCGSGNLTFFCKDSGMTFRRCAGCGLVFLESAPAPRFLAVGNGEAGEETVADAGAVEHETGGLASLAAWTIPRAKGFAKGARMISRHVRGGRLLDIGCGDGRFLLTMREHGGFELHGLEPDAAEADRASRVLGMEIIPGTLEEADYPEGLFDVVTMWDVLEHVQDPLRELREVRRVLRSDGLLLARVPNLTYFRLKQALAGPYLRSRGMSIYGPRHHLTYLDRSTAGLLLEKAGFEIISMRPSRSEYGVGSLMLAAKTCYHAAASAIYLASLGKAVLAVDLLILARPASDRNA